MKFSEEIDRQSFDAINDMLNIAKMEPQTMLKLAEVCSSTYCYWQYNKCNPGIQTLHRVAKVCGCSIMITPEGVEIIEE